MSEHPAQRPYFHLIEAYRGIAAAAIVLHHLGAISAKDYHISLLRGFFTACHVRLDFFFVLSGFLIGWLYKGFLGDSARAPEFLRNRLARIYPLLFILTTVKLGFILLSHAGRWARDPLDLSVILSSYLMLPSDRFPLILPAWTMPYEMMFYLVFAIAIVIGARPFAILASAWSITIVAAHLLAPAIEGTWTSFLLKPFHLQLLAGMGTSFLLQHPFLRGRGLGLMLTGLLLLVGGLLMQEEIELWPALHRRCWWAVVFCTLIAGTAAYEMNRQQHVQVPRWLSSLGKSSYSIYLVHSPVLVISLAYLSPRGWLEGPSRNLVLLLLAALAISAGLLCYRFVERPLNLYFRERKQRAKSPPEFGGTGATSCTDLDWGKPQ